VNAKVDKVDAKVDAHHVATRADIAAVRSDVGAHRAETKKGFTDLDKELTGHAEVHQSSRLKAHRSCDLNRSLRRRGSLGSTRSSVERGS
jgi:hypothetical protein